MSTDKRSNTGVSLDIPTGDIYFLWNTALPRMRKHRNVKQRLSLLSQKGKNFFFSCHFLFLKKAAFMMILVDYVFYTLTGKPQLWLMRYRKNRSNFDFFGRLVMLILRDQ
jgi:hypothetical protein